MNHRYGQSSKTKAKTDNPVAIRMNSINESKLWTDSVHRAVIPQKSRPAREPKIGEMIIVPVKRGKKTRRIKIKKLGIKNIKPP